MPQNGAENAPGRAAPLTRAVDPHLATLLPTLIVLAMIGPLSLNILLPSLPGLVTVFGAPREQVQLALSLFMAAQAVSQLVIGPLADRYGRRPVILAALGIFIAGSIMAALSTSIGVLIVARVLQAIGGTAGLTIGRTVIRDVFAREKAASMIGYVTMAMVIAPMLSPGLGAMLDETFGWRAIFLACLALGLIGLAMTWRRLPETRPADTEDPTFAAVTRRSIGLFRHRHFLGYAVSAAATSAAFFAFLGAAPYLVIDVMGLPKITYGLWFIWLSGGYMIGNFLSGRYSTRFGVDRMILAGNLLAIAGAVVMVMTALAGHLSLPALFLPFVLISIGNGLLLPNAVAAGVGVNPHAAGAASGLMSFLQFGLGGLMTFIAGKLTTTSGLPLASLILALSVLSVAAAAWVRREGAPASA